MNKILLLCLVVCGLITGCGKANTLTDQAKVQLGIDTVIIRKYIAANNLTKVAKEIKSTGEFYIIDTVGTGIPLYTNSTLVTVGFTGTILGGTTPFVTTYTTNFHPSFTIGSVIQGWQYGFPYCKKGGVIRLLVPSGYAYGPYPQTDYGLPANSILDFTIKLYDITN